MEKNPKQVPPSAPCNAQYNGLVLKSLVLPAIYQKNGVAHHTVHIGRDVPIKKLMLQPVHIHQQCSHHLILPHSLPALYPQILTQLLQLVH